MVVGPIKNRGFQRVSKDKALLRDVVRMALCGFVSPVVLLEVSSDALYDLVVLQAVLVE